MKKAIVAIILTLALAAVSVQALATNDESTTTVCNLNAVAIRLTLIEDVIPSLKVSGSSASYGLYVSCISSVNSIKVVMQIQQLSNGKWNDYGTAWNSSSATSDLATSGTKTVESGYSYRLKVSITASNGSSTGTLTAYS